MIKKILITGFLLVMTLYSFSQTSWSGIHYWYPGANVNMDNGNSEGKYYLQLGRWGTYTLSWRNSNPILSVNNQNRVGINTHDPEKGFHVNTTSLFSGDIHLKTNAKMRLNSSGDDKAVLNFKLTNKGDSFTINTKTKRSLVVSGNGNVGINTNFPQYKLDVNIYSAIVGDLRINGAISHVGEKQFSRTNYLLNDDKLVLNRSSITDFDGANQLDITGNMKVREDLILDKVVIGTTTYPDYVFLDKYKLMPLEEVESFILENKHLPNVPSAEQVTEEGMDLAQMNVVLMEKIEELTLHAIDRNKRLEKLKTSYNTVLKEIEKLKKMEE
ncbi:MAG: hypothetical protein ACEPOV_10250 [Hyphomicrobiales bacterium]